MSARTKLARFVMERAVHLRVNAVKLDRVDQLAPADQARAATQTEASELRARARNLIAVTRAKLDELEALCHE